ncbi:phage tail protein [Halomonas sp. V046]|uniref:phage tail protein n=1 Tax=Halomonas sp. V046 TaxID=3459611 RepID=UPI00404404E0
MPQFYTLLTDTGQAKIANAVALGTQIEITQMAVGDGGGNPITPDSSATTLVNEVRRAPINAVQTDEDNPTWITVEQVLPPDVGGWTIREVGVFDAAGDLIAIGNLPETYKPVLAEGSSRTQTIRVVMEVSDTAAVTLKVDPSVVLATREYVDQQRLAHEQSRNHPAATEVQQGMIKNATSVQAKAGDDNSRAMTPTRVHEAMRFFGLGLLYESTSRLSDLNSEIRSGFYVTDPGAANAPPSYDTATTGRLIHNNWDGTSNYAHQILMSAQAGNPSIHYRRKVDGVWFSWTEIVTEQYMKGSRNNLTGYGFQIFPGGLIFQWGKKPAGSASRSANFPIQFPNGVINVVPFDDGWIEPSAGAKWGATNKTASGFTMHTDQVSEGGAYYAWGY